MMLASRTRPFSESVRRSRGCVPSRDAAHQRGHRKQFFATRPVGDIIHAKAQSTRDPRWVAAVVETESRFPERNARSQVGARGLMQLMPKTGAGWGR